MYKTETHLHIEESCYCGNIPATEMVMLYKESGFKTIIITTHYKYEYLKKISSDWDEVVDYMVAGYKNAKVKGDVEGINILYGIEVTLLENKTDYLVYGPTEAFLRENPELYRLSFSGLIELCEKNNFLIVQAHPFRRGMELAPLEYKMPIEVYNGHSRLDQRNHLAMEYAREHNLIGTSGSDFHELEDLAKGGIITDKEIKTIEDFKNAVLSNEFTIITT